MNWNFNLQASTIDTIVAPRVDLHRGSISEVLVEAWLRLLPHANAGLNSLATVLLIVGIVLIKQRREVAHKWTMIGCFGVSTVFLASYLVHKAAFGTTAFPSDAGTLPRIIYYTVLLTHSLLAATVPFLAVTTIYFGLRDWRVAHRKLAKWTFPIWLYVSVTGVVVYLMLYQLYPAH